MAIIKQFVDFENLSYFKTKLDETFLAKDAKIDWTAIENTPNLIDQTTLVENYYSKEEIENKFSGIYHFKGSVENKEALNNIINPSIGCKNGGELMRT